MSWFKAKTPKQRAAVFAHLIAPGVARVMADGTDVGVAVDNTLNMLKRYDFDRDEVRRELYRRFGVTPFAQEWLADYKTALAAARACLE